MASIFPEIASSRPLVMGVVNATPDSFSDGGDAFGFSAALERAVRLMSDGAGIIDIGGESTRPGAARVGEDEEISRTVPVITELCKQGITVSIDTCHAAVMEAALDAGASIINDVTALEGDKRSMAVAAASNASIILMHMQGTPETMQDNPIYGDVVVEVRDYLARRVEACVNAGIAPERIAVDPGIGFGKTPEHNLEILKNLHIYQGLGAALVLGVSRKSFIGAVSGEKDPKARLPGSLASMLAGVARGANIIRVHDVAETVQALDVYLAIEGARDTVLRQK